MRKYLSRMGNGTYMSKTGNPLYIVRRCLSSLFAVRSENAKHRVMMTGLKIDEIIYAVRRNGYKPEQFSFMCSETAIIAFGPNKSVRVSLDEMRKMLMENADLLTDKKTPNDLAAEYLLYRLNRKEHLVLV